MESDHDLLIRLDEKMDYVIRRLDEGDEEMDDHAKRIRGLEKFQAKLVGAAAFASVVITLIITKIESIFGGGTA